MYRIFRKVFFKIDAETVHHFVMGLLQTAYAIAPVRFLIKKNFVVHDSKLARTVFGITFPNPIGLAAGFDKDGKYTDALACLGFGFIEIGTVTPRAQPGNPRPRLFRLPKDLALINRMGFNNQGVENAAMNLRARREKILIGGSIGKNKDTPNENADEDYEKCFLSLFDSVDYFAINVSSPNTPGLRGLQEKEPLTRLLKRLQTLNISRGNPKPILLKIAPDLTNEQLDDIIVIVRETGIAGIIATNTTIDRSNLATSEKELTQIGAGGLSGAPLKNRAIEIVRYIHTHTNGALPIIASGGIFTAEDARVRLQAGATLVEVYTGFIYEGPGIVKKICEGL